VRTQIVAGINYKIDYETSDNKTYEAVVFRQSWTNTTQLSSFKQISPSETPAAAAQSGSNATTTTPASALQVDAYLPVTNLTSNLFMKADAYARS